MITATAFVDGVVDAYLFKNSHQFAAWLGLVHQQYSSGGKSRLGGITKGRCLFANLADSGRAGDCLPGGKTGR